jgi:hypothetical protein
MSGPRPSPEPHENAPVPTPTPTPTLTGLLLGHGSTIEATTVVIWLAAA